MKGKQLETIFEKEGNHGESIELQHDQKGNLYVNNKKLITEKKVKLRTLELILAVITTIALSTEAIIQVLSYYRGH